MPKTDVQSAMGNVGALTLSVGTFALKLFACGCKS